MATKPQIEQLLEHRDFLRALACQLVSDPGTQEDLVSDAMEEAVLRPPRHGALRPWLARVLRNRAKNRQRDAARRQLREHKAAKAEGLPSAAEVVERFELSEQLAEKVQQLPGPYREVVLFRYYENLPRQAIAESLGISVEAVKTRLRRAMEQLRHSLDRDHGSRERWLTALAPLTLPSTPTAALGAATLGALGGTILMSMKTLAPLVLVPLLALQAWFVWSDADTASINEISPEQAFARAASTPVADDSTKKIVAPIETSPSAARRLVPNNVKEQLQIHGVVKGEGDPLEGATVYVLRASKAESFLPSSHRASVSSSVPIERVIVETRSGPGGTFSFSLPEDWNRRQVDVLCRMRGYTRGGVQRIIPSSMHRPLEIHLSRGLSIRGRVVSAAGEDVGDIVVMATTDSSAGGRFLRMQSWHVAQEQARPSLTDDYSWSQAKTDPDGSFEIRGLFRGEYALNVTNSNWLMESHDAVAAGDVDVVLNVARGHRFQIEVKDKDSLLPINRFSFFASILDGGGLHMPGRKGKLDFVYRLEKNELEQAAAALEMKVQITALGFLPGEVHLRSSPGKTTSLSVLLQRPATVRFPVRITDSRNRIVEKARVRYAAPNEQSFLDCPLQKDEKGQQFLLIPVGRWKLQVRHPRLFPGGRPWQKSINVPESIMKRARPTVAIQLDTSARLTLDLRGIINQKTIRFFSFTSEHYIAGLERPIDTEDGFVHWFGLPRGQWTIRVQAKDASPISKKILIDGTSAWLNF